MDQVQQQSTTLFLASCQKKMQQSTAMHHPFLTEFESRYLTPGQLNRFAIQWYKTARGHKEAFPALVYNVRDDDVRYELIDILREEYGNGDREKIHARLLQNFLRALGISADQVVATPTLPEVSIFSDQVMKIWRDDNEVRAFGLHFALEFLASALHVYFAQGLKKYHFLKESDREYFDYHSIAEQRHADYSSIGLERYAELESNRALLEEGVDKGIALMNQLWDGFRAHILN